MKLEGQHRFEAARALVWKALLDPEVLSRTLPGCEKLQSTGENELAGTLNLKIGPVQGTFQGTVQLSDLVPPQGYRLKLHGQGGPGFVDGAGELKLEEDGTGTILRYNVDVQIGGRIASIGQRLVESSAKVITRQALESLDLQIRAIAVAQPAPAVETGPELLSAPPPTPAPPLPPPPPAPTQAQFAAGVARGVLEDLIPPQRRPWLLALGLILLGLAAFALLRACQH